MESSTWQDQLRTYFPLAIAAVPTLFITIRLLTVAGYDPETAYGILQSTGTVAVVVGTTLSLIGSVVAFGAVSCFLLYRVLRSEGNDSNTLPGLTVWAVAAILAITAICIAPVIWVALAGILFIWGLIREFTRQSIVAVMMGALSAIFIGAQFTAPWWPSERVDLRHSKPITAYVLSVSGQDSVILIAKPRKIEHINVNDIARRTYCEPHKSLIDYIYINSLVAFIVNPKGNYPVCPDDQTA